MRPEGAHRAQRAPLRNARDRTSPQRCYRTTLEAEALRLRAKGYQFLEIAEMLGVEGRNPGQKIETLILSALERKGKPDADAIRRDQTDRLDRLLNRAIRIASSDSPDRVAAINAAVSISARLAALNGSDAPKKLEADVNHNPPPAPSALASFVAELAQEDGEEEPGQGGEAST